METPRTGELRPDYVRQVAKEGELQQIEDEAGRVETPQAQIEEEQQIEREAGWVETPQAQEKAGEQQVELHSHPPPSLFLALTRSGSVPIDTTTAARLCWAE